MVGHQVAPVKENRRISDHRATERPGRVEALLVNRAVDFSAKKIKK